MYRRLHAQLVAIGLLPLLAGGCVQTTRHSNMMIFGTNTVVGVRAGVNATSVPEVSIGYTRQEAVVLPLVANVGVTNDDARLVPCDVGKKVEVSAAQGASIAFPVHPCLLVATNGGAKDSYSVLASFGGNFSSTAAVDNVEARAGVAQYFSTGVAAQLLALKGGAAVVAASSAATKSAETATDEATVKAIFGNDEAFNRGVTIAAASVPFTDRIITLVTQQPDNKTVESKIVDFEKRAGITTTLRSKCITQAGCLAALKRGDYDQPYNMNQAAMDRELANF